MYYVVISVNPFDCMGLRSKVLQFAKIEEAITYYKECLSDRGKAITEFVGLYWDEEAIEEAQKEGSNLLVDGQICLISCDVDISNLSGIEYGFDPFEYNSWINDYDGLSFNHVCMSVLEIFELEGAITICSYSFDIPVLSYDAECYKKNRIECDNSLAAIENSKIE